MFSATTRRWTRASKLGKRGSRYLQPKRRSDPPSQRAAAWTPLESVCVLGGRGWGGGLAYRCWALKYLQPSHKLLAASPPAAHIFTATQTKRDQAGGNWLPGHLIDPAMPPFAGQPLLHPPAAGWSSVPHRSLPAPARPRRTQAKFLLGSRGGCGGKSQGWRPWVPPSSSVTAHACSNRSQPLSLPADSLRLRGLHLRNL